MKASTFRDRIRCYKYREYGHFAGNCPNSDMEGELEQIQQMYNLDENQTALQILAPGSCEDLNRANSKEAIDHLH